MIPPAFCKACLKSSALRFALALRRKSLPCKRNTVAFVDGLRVPLICLPTKNSAQGALLFVGAGGGTRTHTVSPPTDFESVTSANSITPARFNSVYFNTVWLFFQCLFKRISKIRAPSVFGGCMPFPSPLVPFRALPLFSQSRFDGTDGLSGRCRASSARTANSARAKCF